MSDVTRLKNSIVQFKLKTLLLSAAVVAFCIGLYPHARNFIMWSQARKDVQAWASGVSRANGQVDPYVHVDYFGDTFAVTTAEPYLDSTKPPPGSRSKWWAIHSPTPHDPNRFFVMPPGVWVNDASEIVDAWDAD